MSAKQVFDLAVKASLENLQEIRRYIDRVGASLGLSESVMGDLRLVVDEAVTNVVLHGYGSLDGSVEIHMEAVDDDVIIRIRDQAKPFDPSLVSAPQLNTALKDRPFGGMGIFLIRKMTDEARFLSLPGGGNEIRLVKRGVLQHDKQA